MNNLNRFLTAQETTFGYNQALTEVKQGKKLSHWIWYIFPQQKGLGKSLKSEYYGIKSLEEAIDYINHPILGKRLIEITTELYNSKYTVYEIFGNDSIKVYSCMKLFDLVFPNDIFHKMIIKYNWH